MAAIIHSSARLGSNNFWLGFLSLSLFFGTWEFSKSLGIPMVRDVPTLSAVITSAGDFLLSSKYWEGWYLSMQRILLGFLAAQLIGVPLGLVLALNRWLHDTTFPVFEMLRPIPPVAWIPVSILFWPTREASVVFIVFLGAFWITLINTYGGARAIDPSYRRAAMSLGSRPFDIFWHIVLPATLPSIFTGMIVGMGIAWEMVVAAEMIAGQTGLGYLLWLSFETNAITLVIVCMISIGFAGYLSSALIRLISRYAMPWH